MQLPSFLSAKVQNFIKGKTNNEYENDCLTHQIAKQLLQPALYIIISTTTDHRLVQTRHVLATT